MASRRTQRTGRRRAQPSSRLYTKYTFEDAVTNEFYIDRVQRDMDTVMAGYPRSVHQSDWHKYLRHYWRYKAWLAFAATCFVTLYVIMHHMDHRWGWWQSLLLQAALMVPVVAVFLITRPHTTDLTYLRLRIFEECDRRGIAYDPERRVRVIKGINGEEVSDAYVPDLVNLINADYNSKMWDRKFEWT
jgi:hypothetical protein